jgi:hypothetical protein
MYFRSIVMALCLAGVFFLTFVDSGSAQSNKEALQGRNAALDECRQREYSPSVLWAGAERCRMCGDCSLNDFIRVAINVTRIIFGLVGSVVLLFFVYGGIKMILSAGNSERIEEAKSIVKNATIGLVVIFISWTIVNFVYTTLSEEKIEWYEAPIEINSTETRGQEVEAILQNSFSFTGSFADLEGLTSDEFHSLAQSYGVDTSSVLYRFYQDEIYNIAQDYLSGNMHSSQELYNRIPRSARVFISQDHVEQIWSILELSSNN